MTGASPSEIDIHINRCINFINNNDENHPKYFEISWTLNSRQIEEVLEELENKNIGDYTCGKVTIGGWGIFVFIGKYINNEPVYYTTAYHAEGDIKNIENDIPKYLNYL